MSEWPKFSVIIPNYNNASTLERAIRSVLNQRYEAHEIIIIDDGSTDDSRNILKKFDSQIKVVFQQNSGVSAARNAGAQVATGEWLAFLDADDEYLPERLQAHADWITRDPEVDFLLADQKACTPEGKLINLFMKSSKSGRSLMQRHPENDEIPISQLDFEDLISDGFGEIRTLSVPRQTFIKLGGFPTDHKIGEDLHFFIRLYAASLRGGVVPKVLAIYYIYPNSTLRKDPVKTMQLFYQAVSSLQAVASNASIPVKIGFTEKRRQTRLSLAYAYLRANRKSDAIRIMIPPLFNQPGFKSSKDFLSICRGFHQERIPALPRINETT